MTWFPLTKLDDWILVSMPLDSEPKFAALVGRTLDHWSYLESQLRLSMMHLLECGADAADVLFYSIVSNSTRLDIITSLARHLMPEGPEKEGFLSLVERCRELNKARNDIVHCEYHTDSPIGRMLVKPRTTRGPLRNYHSYREADLEAHIAAVTRLSLQFSFANERDPQEVMPPVRTSL